MEHTTDIVRKNTSSKRNALIDAETFTCLVEYAGKSNEEIEDRILQLEKEWDIERVLQLNAAVISLSGILLSQRNPKWAILSGVVAVFLIQHAVQGWCPPVELFRALGYRTRMEIDQEKYALKALRGDFNSIGSVLEAWNESR
jgi:hypothetical protein